MPTVLVIDDDPLVELRSRRDLEPLSIEVQTARTAGAGLDLLRQQAIDVVVLDVMLPDQSGLDTLREIRRLDSHLPVIIITAGTASDTAIEAIQAGAFDYLTKPLDREALRALIARAIEIRRMSSTPVAFAATSAVGARSGDMLVGRCEAIQRVYKAIGRVAAQDITVLITGESGTGKELVARAIYQHGRRAAGPFLAINCAAIPETLLESELFGHEKGAFTGADQMRIGKFEQCHGGTLFLDEIGDMSPTTQSKVLRVLQEHSFERVGGRLTIHADVRVIAATNHNLQQLVAEGNFRQDLFYRLNEFSIQLPPLRERTGDLPLLLEHFLARLNRELGRNIRGVSPDALDLLLRFPWPGNVRELQSVLKQAMLAATGDVLLPDFLPESVRRAPGSDRPDATWEEGAASNPMTAFVAERIAAGSESLYAESVARLERQLFTQVLQHTRGNQLQAARILGITRATLRHKLQLYGITVERIVSHAD